MQATRKSSCSTRRTRPTTTPCTSSRRSTRTCATSSAPREPGDPTGRGQEPARRANADLQSKLDVAQAATTALQAARRRDRGREAADDARPQRRARGRAGRARGVEARERQHRGGPPAADHQRPVGGFQCPVWAPRTATTTAVPRPRGHRHVRADRHAARRGEGGHRAVQPVSSRRREHRVPRRQRRQHLLLRAPLAVRRLEPQRRPGRGHRALRHDRQRQPRRTSTSRSASAASTAARPIRTRRSKPRAAEPTPSLPWPDAHERSSRVLDPAYLDGLDDRSVDELRAKHAECLELETEVSYVRRLTQARIDILEAELDGAPAADRSRTSSTRCRRSSPTPARAGTRRRAGSRCRWRPSRTASGPRPRAVRRRARQPARRSPTPSSHEAIDRPAVARARGVRPAPRAVRGDRPHRPPPRRAPQLPADPHGRRPARRRKPSRVRW